jgi:2-iminobutanoate/2-iminopropanoate deaminase
MARKPATKKKSSPKKKVAARSAGKATARKPASTRKVINPPGLAKPTVPLSNAVKVGNIVFVSGSTPIAPDGSIAKGDFAAQMATVMDNIKVILASAGSSLDRVVKVNVILVRISDFWTMNGIYKTYFKEGNYPARTTIEAPLAHPDFLLEIECVAEAS